MLATPSAAGVIERPLSLKDVDVAGRWGDCRNGGVHGGHDKTAGRLVEREGGQGAQYVDVSQSWERIGVKPRTMAFR